MTREESKAKTFDILHFVADNAGLSTFEAIEKAYNMGVSEQKSVLDKIKDEIIQMSTISLNANDIYKADVLAIINKYKIESEEDN